MSGKDVADRQAAEELERQGDEAARSGGEAAEAFYRNAQKILLPVGVLWSDAVEYDLRMAAFQRLQQKIWALHSVPPRPPAPAPSEARKAFDASMVIGYEQWHDGIGYDLDALAKLTEAERGAVASDLIHRITSGDGGWRDVEALVALGTNQAKRALQDALPRADLTLRLHIGHALAGMGAAVEMDRIIADALRGGDSDGSHSFALDLAVRYATPYLREVLLERARNGGSAVLRVHAAALSLYLAGQAKRPFDWEQRPFFLQFGEDDPGIRARAYNELCRRLGLKDDG